MEQFKKIVLEAPDGMHYTTTQGESGDLIVRLVSNSSEKSPNKETCSQRVCAEETDDKARFFTKITDEDREKVKNWLQKQQPRHYMEISFLARVGEALEAVHNEYWIANLEPSVANGEIYYAEGNDVCVRFSANQWEQMAKEYAPERGSRLSNLHELFIWYALRIVNGLWTLKYVANDSSDAGNYSNAPRAAHYLEKTGARECGGFRDGQGNSYKIVTCEGGYAVVGGDYYTRGEYYHVANFYSCNNHYSIPRVSSGVLVLTK